MLPRIFIAPEPRAVADIFTGNDLDRLRAIGDVVLVEHGLTDPDVERDALDAQIVMGQFDLPRERLDRMPNLRAVFNVEGNFLGNIDYAECFRRGIRVLSTSPVFAEPVAEATLGMVIDLARNVTSADRRFREGTEAYGLAANVDSFTLYDAEVGFVGLGDLGRAMLPLFAPFRCRVRAYDPWLPASYLASLGVRASTLGEVLQTSRVVIVVAGVTAENEGFLGREAFAKMQPGAAFVLVSRAGALLRPANKIPPVTVPSSVPLPPRRPVPLTTATATATIVSAKPIDMFADADESRTAKPTPAIDGRPKIAYATTLVRSIANPAIRLAGSLLPIAGKVRPTRVRLRMNEQLPAATSMTTNSSGTPVICVAAKF